MRRYVLGLGSLPLLLVGCSSVSDPDTANGIRPNPVCAEIKQKLAGSATENIPSYRTVTATERTELLQQYHDLGCTEGYEDSSDEND